MTRALALTALSLTVLLSGCGLLRHKPKVVAPAPAKAVPQPLAAPPVYLKTAEDFFALWKNGNGKSAYDLLSERMKKAVSEQDWRAQLAEVRLSKTKVIAYTGIEEAAYVVLAVQAQQDEKVAKPIAGYSVLLKKEKGKWRVALLQSEDKITEKYGNLKIISRQKKGYLVSYTDEKGVYNTRNLQEP